MKKTIAIIGGGPSAFAAAAFLNPEDFDVSIYERNKAVGRKFLVAGKGGFNLTHSEGIETMISRYSNDAPLASALRAFTNEDLRAWLKEIGVPTFVGSSKRVYPEEGIKPIEVLSSILKTLEDKDVQIHYQNYWTGWNETGDLTFQSGETISPDYTIFSLGGGSWKVTGSDGSWRDIFSSQGIETTPFLPANCAYRVNWNEAFIEKAEGQPLKNIALECRGKRCSGELVITQFGLEGNAIYALSSEIQAQLSNTGTATVFLDLKPALNGETVLNRLTRSNKKTTEALKNHLKLSKVQVQLLKSLLNKEEFTDLQILAERIKSLPIQLESAAPIDEAISTTGGISMAAINDNFELNDLSNTFCIGEMLDWNAPTGGYLLQACFSMGFALAHHLNNR
jgi:uncharacterized flavoprotein (TIGR03862 family)